MLNGICYQLAGVIPSTRVIDSVISDTSLLKHKIKGGVELGEGVGGCVVSHFVHS